MILFTTDFAFILHVMTFFLLNIMNLYLAIKLDKLLAYNLLLYEYKLS